MMPTDSSPAAVVGGGPAGLRAAEVLAEAGLRVALLEQKPSVGRKFLVAGRGGLNLTHSENLATFAGRYLDGEAVAGVRDPGPRWTALLAEFGPGDLRAWAARLDIETYVGTSGRVFPKGQQAAALLRSWVTRLRRMGVEFHMNHSWRGMSPAPAGDGWRLQFAVLVPGGETRVLEVQANAVVFALGGASWPQTGSDGRWPTMWEALGVQVAPWKAANCGFEAGWSEAFLEKAEGLPLKNIRLTAADRTVAGEVVITRYGLEGGAVYQLGAILRRMERPALLIDLKPMLSAEQLAAKLPPMNRRAKGGAVLVEDVARCWRLGPAAQCLLRFHGPGASAERAAWIEAVKRFPLALRGPRPIEEAISSAGGVAWSELDEATLMVRRLPGVFVAGEMIDWEAPTGGYLLQGCFATGTRAGRGARDFVKANGDQLSRQPI